MSSPTKKVAINNLIAPIRHCRMVLLNYDNEQVIDEHDTLWRKDKATMHQGWEYLDFSDKEVEELYVMMDEQIEKFKRDIGRVGR